MKTYMKVFTAGIIAATMLAGCGSAASTSATASSVQNISDTSAENAASTQTAAEETSSAQGSSASGSSAEAVTNTSSTGSDGKILVMYFSGTGNTKNVADMIVADTGADEYEVTPSEPYTEEDLDYSNQDSRVVKEHEDESLQDVAFDSYDIPNWDSYDTVFVGYPIWWQDASWVMKSFVKNVDFSGKTVIPFCTSSASGIGDSAKNLASLTGTGDWQDGQRFSSSASEQEVQDWVSSLGF